MKNWYYTKSGKYGKSPAVAVLLPVQTTQARQHVLEGAFTEIREVV